MAKSICARLFLALVHRLGESAGSPLEWDSRTIAASALRKMQAWLPLLQIAPKGVRLECGRVMDLSQRTVTCKVSLFAGVAGDRDFVPPGALFVVVQFLL